MPVLIINLRPIVAFSKRVSLTFACGIMTLMAFAAMAQAATFGTVIPIGGQASDIALDESRRSLYIANYTGNRIDVLSTDTNTIARSIVVTAQPSALALSPDGKYLVVAHFKNFDPASN